MLKFLEKINPLNWIEKIIIKRMAKKLAKALTFANFCSIIIMVEKEIKNYTAITV